MLAWSAPEDLIQPIRAGHPIHRVQTARKFWSANGFDATQSCTNYSAGKVGSDFAGWGNPAGSTVR